MAETGKDSEAAALERLVERSWEIYRRSEEAGHSFVVRPSIPITFFGDSPAYFHSAVRIVTVGLNPSLQEFPREQPLMRFPAAGSASGGPLALPAELSASLTALNAYFRTEPYRRWFASYEPILNGAGASYYVGAPSVALHTDVCSPLATDPTWSRLAPDAQTTLAHEGRSLWHDLVRVLAPDAIVISVARHHLAQILLDPVDDWHPLFTVDRQRPFIVDERSFRVVPDKITRLVFGRAAHTPFGTVSAKDRRTIGEAIRRSLDAR